MSVAKYQITTGKVWLDNVLIGKAYSGKKEAIGQTDKENVKGVGPIPEGDWHISNWTSDGHLGPVISRLTPIDVPKLYGRSGFYIHGDNKSVNFSASNGCIIMNRKMREKIRDSKASVIKVIK